MTDPEFIETANALREQYRPALDALADNKSGRVQTPEKRPYQPVERESMQGHNHLTRDIKDRGWCPACDYWWERSEEANDD